MSQKNDPSRSGSSSIDPGTGTSPTTPASTKNINGFFGWYRSLGPAIIVASVVLGPGSIYLSSAIGVEFGFALLWVPLLTTVLMICLVILAGRLGVIYDRTLLEELAHRLGRPAAAFTGLIVFLITTSFQTANNAAILFAVDPILEMIFGQPANEIRGGGTSLVILVILNGFILAVLFGFKRLYPPMEKLMIALVLVMLVGFIANLVYAQPALQEIGRGLIPSIPAAASGQPPLNWTLVVGFLGTTVSMAGVFYQSYLVKEKGWSIRDVKSGMTDSLLGIGLLGLISAIIMTTAAVVLHNPEERMTFGSAVEIARQLEPLFGPTAVILFSLGLFAGAFSSFMINAMIGGTLLADGLGQGGRIDQQSTRMFTAGVLLLGMTIALVSGGTAPEIVITFAQALTVLGLPVLVLAMVYLVTRRELNGSYAIPFWMKLVLYIGTVAVVIIAVSIMFNLLFT
ncbi:Nramp family divalent metal transporter [Natronogracilivirga saccharolytica]|uniref:Nramp family divalent metal transporter n=1 Tax=Natronogracilivirga saccharolytica TaxID=2812953 RepID=A0A8J7RVT8_9BACT|nr:Nramp family divalent metal transporter [Natronogracilivirga saccharolytica]MBP3193872.1 Nramp family divalent metal transporter [Natronogracilivirga saccharolytica]